MRLQRAPVTEQGSYPPRRARADLPTYRAPASEPSPVDAEAPRERLHGSRSGCEARPCRRASRNANGVVLPYEANHRNPLLSCPQLMEEHDRAFVGLSQNPMCRLGALAGLGSPLVGAREVL
jgi:hypothetical protein